jgi:acetyltransferase-like isoleucine patch superfamily enzyme
MRAALGRIHRRIEQARIDDASRRLMAAGKLAVGTGTYGTPVVYDIEGDYDSKVRIGKFCSLGGGVRILLGGEHRTDWVSTFPFRFRFSLQSAAPEQQPFSRGDVVIGNDVWIGNDAFIRSGVTIGDGAVVGAAAVVARDVMAYEIVAGNPCQRLRLRFREDQIAILLSIGWWDWPLEKILRFVPLLSSPDVDAFIAEALRGTKSA